MTSTEPTAPTALLPADLAQLVERIALLRGDDADPDAAAALDTLIEWHLPKLLAGVAEREADAWDQGFVDARAYGQGGPKAPNPFRTVSDVT